MRWITARQVHECVVCKERIPIGEVCIQSSWQHYYHEECHRKRFQWSGFHEPTNERPE